ncbi:hypothetical protein GC163_11345 [bacterium]|nr:hypothetical protein [bacterium]
MAMMPIILLLGLFCLAPVLLAVAIVLGIWAWHHRDRWPDPKVFLICGGVALLLFLMLGVSSSYGVVHHDVSSPVMVTSQHFGEEARQIATQTLPHQITVPAPVIVRHYPMAWGLILILGLNVLFGCMVALYWRMPRTSAEPGMSTAARSSKTAAWLVSVGVAVGMAVLIAGLAMPVIQQAREVQRREAAKAELHRIGEALHGLVPTSPTFEEYPAPVVYQTDLTAWSLIFIAGAIFLVAWLVTWLLRRPNVPESTHSHDRHSGRTSAAGIMAFTFAMVLLGFIGTYRYRSVNVHHATLQTEQHAIREIQKVEEETLKRLSEDAADTRILAPQTVAIDTGLTRISDGDIASALTPLNQEPAEIVTDPEPEWLKKKPPAPVHGSYHILSGGEHVTEQEAEDSARNQVAQLVEIDARKYISNIPFRLRNLSLTPQTHMAIKDRYLRVKERDFGSFKAPMYRVTYLLELSPQVREPYITQVQASAKEGRLIAAAVAFGALWLAPLGMVLSARLVRAMGGKARRGLPLLAGLLVLLSWGATAVVLNEYVVIFNV